MKNFGWSKVQLRDGRVIMGPAREDKLGAVPYLYIEAIDTDGLLYPSYFQFGQVASIVPVDEKYARELFRLTGHSISEVKRVVAKTFSVTVETLEGPDRHDEIVKPRWIAFAISRELGFKLNFIGKAFNRDHGTILYGVEEAYKRCDVDCAFKAQLNWCRKRFGLSPDYQKPSPATVSPTLQHSQKN